jgi:hypothetical protein
MSGGDWVVISLENMTTNGPKYGNNPHKLGYGAPITISWHISISDGNSAPITMRMASWGAIHSQLISNTSWVQMVLEIPDPWFLQGTLSISSTYLSINPLRWKSRVKRWVYSNALTSRTNGNPWNCEVCGAPFGHAKFETHLSHLVGCWLIPDWFSSPYRQWGIPQNGPFKWENDHQPS